tara:strand:- start:698 stop:1183 length:486 start_codon:yes stop_codon:yes gene_type:complete
MSKKPPEEELPEEELPEEEGNEPWISPDHPDGLFAGTQEDPSAPENQWQPSKVLGNMDEFYGTLQGSNMLHACLEVEIFVKNYEAITKGCNCGRKKRIVITEESYKQVARVSNGEIHGLFQQFYKVSSVIFKQNGEYLGTFGVPSNDDDEPVFDYDPDRPA